jgi:hypothetical protein
MPVVSTGDLSSGVFIFAIALHTYFTIVKGRRVPNKVFYIGIALCWTFVYLMAIIGVGIDPKVYKRAGAWVSVVPRRCSSHFADDIVSVGSTRSTTANGCGCITCGFSW